MGPDVLYENNYFKAFQVPGRGEMVVIEFKPCSSDASPTRHPSRTGRRMEPDGTVNYYERADDHTYTHWKKRLGQLLTKHVVLPEVRRMGDRRALSIDKSIILNFPEGYELYNHRKGDRHDPRRDAYLIGSRHVNRFRSPQEFFLHAKWLMEGQPLDREGFRACSCCYCNRSGVSQGDIARQYGLGHVSESGARSRRPRQSRRVNQTPSAIAIQAKDYTRLHTSSTT
ncbi:hypothetical protein K474DRAFT_1656713 [Panus rudis PR-1116 ss-1]|nr:hypothetical protein K474DRAFT_1656713 [Panus rudis PR-1116 ss-1]